MWSLIKSLGSYSPNRCEILQSKFHHKNSNLEFECKQSHYMLTWIYADIKIIYGSGDHNRRDQNEVEEIVVWNKCFEL
jgi:hypothetical protein